MYYLVARVAELAIESLKSQTAFKLPPTSRKMHTLMFFATAHLALSHTLRASSTNMLESLFFLETIFKNLLWQWKMLDKFDTDVSERINDLSSKLIRKKSVIKKLKI